MQPNYFTCFCCGKSKPINQRILLGGDALCYACGERVYRKDVRQVNNRTVCPQCYGQIHH